MNYLPLLIARCSSLGGSYSSSLQYDEPFDTKERFGFILKHSPYHGSAKPKNIISQNWNDSDGEDTFIPAVLFYDASEIEYTFVYHRDDECFNTNAESFKNEIQGRWIKIYDSYTQQAKKGLYLIEYSISEYKRRTGQTHAIITMKFKVNDSTVYTNI